MNKLFSALINTSPIAAAACMIFLSSPALASSYATASITNLGYTLIDLDPSDGIAPSITWNNKNGAFVDDISTILIGYTPYGGGGTTYETTTHPVGTDLYSNLSTSDSSPTAQAAASAISGPSTHNPTGASLYASGGSTFAGLPGEWDSYEASARSSGYSPDSIYNNFTLSPYTKVVFTGDANVTGQLNLGFQQTDPYPSLAQSIAELRVQSSVLPSSYVQDDFLIGNFSPIYEFNPATQSYGWVGGQNSRTGVLTVSFSNNDSSDVSAFFQPEVAVSGTSTVNGVPAIPEPKDSALLISGLGLIGMVTWRRNQRKLC